jgi:hypothetical protein
MSPWLQQINSLTNARQVPKAPGARKAFEIGQSNLQAVLDSVTRGAINVSAVVEETGLSRETVGRYFRELQSDGKIRKVAYAHWEVVSTNVERNLDARNHRAAPVDGPVGPQSEGDLA